METGREGSKWLFGEGKKKKKVEIEEVGEWKYEEDGGKKREREGEVRFQNKWSTTKTQICRLVGSQTNVNSQQLIKSNTDSCNFSEQNLLAKYEKSVDYEFLITG